MAVTPNLGLVLESSLTSVAKQNLLKLDSLGATFNLDSQQNTIIRSKSNIILLPNEASAGGSGVGGSIQFGTAAQPLTNFSINATAVSLSNLTLKDTASGSTGLLSLTYKSDATGSVDNTARSLIIDVENGNRTLVLSSNLRVLGGEVGLTGPANVTLPATGTLVNQDSAEVLSNKTLDKLRLTAGSFTQTIETGTLSSNLTFVLPTTAGTQGQILTKGTGNALEWTTPSGVADDLAFDWNSSDGTNLTIVHNLNSFKVMVQILDNQNNYANIEVNQVTRPTLNTVQLSSLLAPSTTWTVLVRKIA